MRLQHCTCKVLVAAVGQTIASTFVEEESPNSAGQCAG
jgi:hypothetical protein